MESPRRRPHLHVGPGSRKKVNLGAGVKQKMKTNTSSGSVYKIGATSIVSIVGVIVGICAVLLLFVVISRKKYGEESDDELPMAYGYRIDGGSVVRLSPTFLHNGESSMVGGHPSNLDHDNTSSSGESGEEKNVYFGNSMMFDNYQTNMDSGAMAAASYSKQSEGFQSMYSSMASQNSESWSSVLDSDIDQSHTSRNTRDTTLSGLTTTPMHSECGSTRSRLQSGNIRDTYADDVMSDTSSNYRFTGATSVASPLARDTAPQGYDVYAVGNERPTAGSNAAPPRSTAANSFYRTSSIARSSGYSDYLDGDAGRSTGASSIYSVGERVSA
uniref:Uncharacterized protein n=1 Tax=Globisporangium ultimum (strain ATCC 200006 / CBS 805.95 / DAOM BR144) TaxID=431595 RepID=K3WFE1_GLOUD